MSQEWRITGASSWGYCSSGGAKTTFCPVLLFQPVLPFPQTSSVPSSHHSLGSITGRKGDPCRVESAVSTGRHLGFSQICFLIFVLPLGKREPGVNLCFAGRRTTCQDLFQDGFFAVHWGWSGDVMRGECSPVLGWVVMPTLHCRALSETCGVSAISDSQYFFSAEHTRELIPLTSPCLTPNGSCKCSSDETLQQFPYFQDDTDKVHSWKSLSVLCC